MSKLTEAENALLVDAFRRSTRNPEHLAFLVAPVVERIIAERKREAPVIDTCPECGEFVNAVHSMAGRARAAYRTDPCRHFVKVTYWANRIQLEKAA